MYVCVCVCVCVSDVVRPECWDDEGLFVDARFEAGPDAIGSVLSSAITTAVTWRR